MGFHDFSALLQNAIVRSGAKTRVDAARVVLETNKILAGILPVHRRGDADARSFRNKQLKIICAHAATVQFLQDQEFRLRHSLQKELPDLDITSIRYELGTIE